jgi:YfiH family protein
MEWRERDGVRWLEARLPGATAVFTTRTGGASEPPFDGLNLGALSEDDRDAVAENRRRLAAALGFAPEQIAVAHQVHGADLVAHDAPGEPSPFADPGSPIPKADGHVIAGSAMAGLVLVADCVPIALAGPGGAAILHCGWRGLASSGRASRRTAEDGAGSGLIERGVTAVGATAAAVGPSIGPCCYEVGDEVLEAFDGLDGVASGRMLDLPAVAGALLRAAGVERVETSGLCTSCEAKLFFSHRRDAGRTGRQAGLVWRHREDDRCPG